MTDVTNTGSGERGAGSGERGAGSGERGVCTAVTCLIIYLKMADEEQVKCHGCKGEFLLAARSC